MGVEDKDLAPPMAHSCAPFDSSVGRAVDCRGYTDNAEIHRSLVQIRLEGEMFFQHTWPSRSQPWECRAPKGLLSSLCSQEMK